MNEFRPQGLQVLPPIVKNIIIINVIIFIATIVFSKSNIDLGHYLALHSFKSVDAAGNHLFKPWQLITHLFMHGGGMFGPSIDYEGGFMHLFSNMFGLYMFGTILEQLWGSKKFLNFYLLCGIGAGLCHLLVLNYEQSVLLQAVADYCKAPKWDAFSALISKNNLAQSSFELQNLLVTWSEDPSNATFAAESVNALNNSYVPSIVNETSVGASGAIFGILGAFAYLFPNTYLYLYFMFPIKVKYAIALYAAYEIYTGFRHSAGDNIAHFAHLGGLLVGVAIVLFWNKTNKKSFY
jgi:membrane associated rhomboid family serine protease